jgi:hypothetical protein
LIGGTGYADAGTPLSIRVHPLILRRASRRSWLPLRIRDNARDSGSRANAAPTARLIAFRGCHAAASAISQPPDPDVGRENCKMSGWHYGDISCLSCSSIYAPPVGGQLASLWPFAHFHGADRFRRVGHRSHIVDEIARPASQSGIRQTNLATDRKPSQESGQSSPATVTLAEAFRNGPIRRYPVSPSNGSW